MNDEGPWKSELGVEGGSDPVMEVGFFVAIHGGLWHSLPPLRCLVSPPHRVLVSSGET